jgi:hypothetical protein
MAEKLSWKFTASVLGGLTFARGGDLDVEAYVKVAVTIKKGTTQDVEIFPGAGGSAQLVVISAVEPSDKLTYELGGNKVALDGPLVLIGSGAVGLLGAKVGTLKFENKAAQDIDIEIIAARDATP